MSDSINHPSHYTFGRFEVIDVLEDWFPDDPLLWQVGKYIARAGRKGDALEDLRKAFWYLNRKIVQLQKGDSNDRGILTPRKEDGGAESSQGKAS